MRRNTNSSSNQRRSKVVLLALSSAFAINQIMAGTKRTNTGSKKAKSSSNDQSPGYLVFKEQEMKGRKKRVADILNEWNNMDDAEKQKFEDMANKAEEQPEETAEKPDTLRSASHESGKTEGEMSMQPEANEDLSPGFIEKDVLRYHHENPETAQTAVNSSSTGEVVETHEEEKTGSQQEKKTRGRKPKGSSPPPAAEGADNGDKRQRVTRQRSVNV